MPLKLSIDPDPVRRAALWCQLWIRLAVKLLNISTWGSLRLTARAYASRRRWLRSFRPHIRASPVSEGFKRRRTDAAVAGAPVADPETLEPIRALIESIPPSRRGAWVAGDVGGDPLRALIDMGPPQ